MSKRTDALAERLELGALALANLAATLTDAEWQTPVPHDGRTIGVIVHHVAIVYPLEVRVSLNSYAPLTCQFLLEDHAVRHSYHHLARIRAALESLSRAA